MLLELLINFGLSQNEALAYAALIESGKLSVAQLSKLSGVTRTTLYGVLELLLNKGLIKRHVLRGSTSYEALGVNAFLNLVQERKEQLTKMEQLTNQLKVILPTYALGRSGNIPKIDFAEGKKAVENLLYEGITLWRESYKRLNYFTMWGYQDHSFVEQYRKWHDYAWKIRDEREEICLFSNVSGVQQQKQAKIKNREIRPLPDDLEFASSIWVHGEYVLLGATRRSPHYAVLINDAVLASNLRAVFQLIWKYTGNG